MGVGIGWDNGIESRSLLVLLEVRLLVAGLLEVGGVALPSLGLRVLVKKERPPVCVQHRFKQYDQGLYHKKIRTALHSHKISFPLFPCSKSMINVKNLLPHKPIILDLLPPSIVLAKRARRCHQQPIQSINPIISLVYPTKETTAVHFISSTI